MQNSNNTEYVPTKCRITKPPPPKPATNPLQFVKVAPCPLFQKAHEQIKKVEEIKKERKEVREEAEDWQQVKEIVNVCEMCACMTIMFNNLLELILEPRQLEELPQKTAGTHYRTCS